MNQNNQNNSQEIKKHPIDVNGIPMDKNFGIEIGKLRYDKLQEVLEGIKEEIERQSVHDKTLGRIELSAGLHEVRVGLDYSLARLVSTVIRICKPYIEKEKKL